MQTPNGQVESGSPNSTKCADVGRVPARARPNSRHAAPVPLPRRAGRGRRSAQRNLVRTRSELFDFAVRSHARDLDARATDVFTDTPTSLAALGASLHSAVADGQLRLAYQPEFDLRSGRITAVEALVRWQHPRLGELGPESFISLAERSDLIKVIGNWVIDQSLRAFASWGVGQLTDGLILRINVSPLQLADADLAVQIGAALTRHDVSGECVCVELTEHAPLRDPNAVAHTLGQLKALGVTSAIDDLATGYSTLSNLRLLPFDVIKIDRSLVSSIDQDRRAQVIVAAIIGLARSFDIGIVGEGVENDAEAAMLLQLGCSRAQGHHLAKPMNAEAISRLLRDENHTTDNTAYR